MQAIRLHEAELSFEALRCLAEINGITVYGVQQPKELDGRVPTICFNLRGKSPAEVASLCSDHGIGVRDGNMYSPRLLRRLAIPDDTGAVRASLAHYNTQNEIHRFAEVLQQMAD
jgi:selenocysteine lyase/cysteine desulfurase